MLKHQCKCGSKQVKQCEEKGAGNKFVCIDWPNCPTLPYLNLVAYANDSKSFSQLRIRKLEDLGLNVLFCQNTGEIFQLFARPARQQPKMLVLDATLAHGDEFNHEQTNGSLNTGVEIYKKLRLTHDPCFPVVIYTTMNHTFEKLKAIDDPFMDVIAESDSHSTEQIIQAVYRLWPD